jgi:hypothetical protein
MNYTNETLNCVNITKGTISSKAHELGMAKDEPIIVIIDRLIYYAKAHKKQYETPICDDGFSGDPFKMMLSGVKTMLDAQGGYALMNNISTDSKDNGTCFNMIEKCCEVAGFNIDDL